MNKISGGRSVLLAVLVLLIVLTMACLVWPHLSTQQVSPVQVVATDLPEKAGETLIQKSLRELNHASLRNTSNILNYGSATNPSKIAAVQDSKSAKIESDLARSAASNTVVDRLPVEGLLIDGNGALKLEEAMLLAKEQDFPDLIAAMELDMQTNAAASEFTQLYKNAVNEQLQSLGGENALSAFTCGLKLCAGIFTSAAGSELWSEWEQLRSADPRTPVYVNMVFQSQLPSGETLRRFIYSIDPSNRSVVVPSQKKPSGG